MNRLFITGDTHGDFCFLPKFCEENHTTTNDVLIILGDSALRFEGANKAREEMRKEFVADQPITIFALRGNHDRPYDIDGDVKLTSCPLINNMMWHDVNYPNIWYFIDGETYIIKDMSFLTIGGAYSVDKEYRQMMHWTWYEGEQISYSQQCDIIDLYKDESFDYVLTHTCPYDDMPTDLFMKGIDQSKVDNSMEKFFEVLKDEINYSHWLFGHFHADRVYNYGKFRMLYHDIVEVTENGELIETEYSNNISE